MIRHSTALTVLAFLCLAISLSIGIISPFLALRFGKPPVILAMILPPIACCIAAAGALWKKTSASAPFAMLYPDFRNALTASALSLLAGSIATGLLSNRTELLLQSQRIHVEMIEQAHVYGLVLSAQQYRNQEGAWPRTLESLLRFQPLQSLRLTSDLEAKLQRLLSSPPSQDLDDQLENALGVRYLGSQLGHPANPKVLLWKAIRPNEFGDTVVAFADGKITELDASSLTAAEAADHDARSH